MKLALLLAVIALGCGCAFKFNGNARIQSSAFETRQPRRVAVMPFRNATDLPDAGEIARSVFFNALLTRHYQAVDCEAVDKALAEIGVDYAKDPLKVHPSILRDRLPADAALYGEVLEFSTSYWLVYSHLRLRARVALFDIATGEEIFSDEAEILNRRLSPPISIPGILFSSLETLYHLREAQKYETFRELAHRTVSEMPEIVPVAASGDRFIKSIRVAVPRQTLVAGDTVRVTVTASSGQRGYFCINSLHCKVPLEETPSGVYSGHYVIQPGDNAEYCLVEVYLFDSKDVPLSALNSKVGFAVDTAAPQPPKILDYYTTERSIILALEEPADSDFAEFNIFRATNGEEMQWIGKTNETSFEDEDVEPLTRYQYVVEATDRSGNASRTGEPFTVSLPSRGPVTVGEDFTRDVTLTQFGSPYYFNRVARIAPDVTVRIHPGVKMYFEDGAGLSIAGQLVAVGAPDEPITFTGADGWKGLYCAGETTRKRAVIQNALISEAHCGVILENSGADLDNVQILRNKTGIVVAGNSELTMQGCVIRKNDCGVDLTGGSLNIRACDFAGNKIGVKVFPDRIIIGDEKKQNVSITYSTLSRSSR